MEDYRKLKLEEADRIAEIDATNYIKMPGVLMRQQENIDWCKSTGPTRNFQTDLTGI